MSKIKQALPEDIDVTPEGLETGRPVTIKEYLENYDPDDGRFDYPEPEEEEDVSL